MMQEGALSFALFDLHISSAVHAQ